VLVLCRKVLGPEHPETLATMHSLAFFYFAADRKDESLKLLEELLVLSRKVLGPEHPETISAMHNLALSYSDAGRNDEAAKLRAELEAKR
jgi:Tetratricopeptide repeat